MANMKIEAIEGIGRRLCRQTLCRRRASATPIPCSRRAAPRRGRAAIAEKCDVSEKLVLKWVNMADLFRINGVGSEYAELLECGGVDTAKELAHAQCREPGGEAGRGERREEA